MRSKFKWIFTLLVAFTMQFSFAQQKTVTGTVTSEGKPLPEATVIISGTGKGVKTDENGKFSIKASQGDVLDVSFAGKDTKSATVGAGNVVNVTLATSQNIIDTVIIDGYRSTKKSKSSVSAATITSEVFEGRPNVSFLQSLQAVTPGLNIATASGSPGSAKIDILIRGVGSVNGSTEPLIVIDGLPANQATFRGLNSQDIESVTVLKDAGATAIYGNRGANGVLVVRTKKGKLNQKMKIGFTSSLGFTTLQDNDYRFADAKQTLRIERDFGAGLGSLNPSTGSPFTDAEIEAFPINTKWKDYFFRTGLSKDNNVSFTMGGDKVTNYTSLGIFDQDGIVPNTNFKRFTLRSNFTGKSENERFTYTTNFTGAYSKRTQLDQETRTDINANILQNPLQGLLTSLPYADPNVYVNGQQLFNDFGGPSFQITPYMLLDYLRPGNIPSSFNEVKILANFSGTYKLTKKLSFTNTSGVDFAENERLFARAPQSYLAIVATPPGAQFGGIETQSKDIDFGFSSINKLTYSTTFSDLHSLDVSVYTQFDKAHRKFFSYTQTGLDPRTYSPGAGTGYIPFNPATPTFYRPAVAGLKRDAGLFSYFATADYDYNSKYGISGTIRRDASYKFINDNQWGTFWSVSGRWNIDREAFMTNSIFKELKLRGSIGTTGNQNVTGAASGFNPLFNNASSVRDLNSSQSGYGNAASLGVANIGNPTLRWETTKQSNIGLDFNVNKRLTGSIDVYDKKTLDLFDQNYVSAVNQIYTQASNTTTTLRNRGVEAVLNFDVFKSARPFQLDLFVNGSYNKNEYGNLTYAPGTDRNANAANIAQQNGGPVDQYNVAPYIGVNPANGNLWFLDVNGNVTENVGDADRRATGKSYIPVYQGGFGFNADYKGFFVSTLFSFAAETYRFDFDLLNSSDPTAIGVFAVTTDFFEAWTPSNTNASYPSLNATNLAVGDTFSDRFLRDASYVRLKNASFGYNFSKKQLAGTFLQSVRIFAQAENFVTWTKWRGLDPEGLNASNQGGYPNPKVVSFGLDIQF